MLHGSPIPGAAGSELIRLLAHLADAPPAGHPPAFAERLGQWLSWSGAISLTSALQVGDGTCVPAQRQGPHPADTDCQRVRAALQASIAAGPHEPASSPADFGPYRRHCVAQQQAMHEAVGALRHRLRLALASHSPQGARLAAIDAALDQALASRERSLLGLVPLRLQAHFERLLRNAQVDGAAAVKGDWRQPFLDDMARVLRAELTHRLLPAQGLLQTLRHHSPT